MSFLSQALYWPAQRTETLGLSDHKALKANKAPRAIKATLAKTVPRPTKAHSENKGRQGLRATRVKMVPRPIKASRVSKVSRVSRVSKGSKENKALKAYRGQKGTKANKAQKAIKAPRAIPGPPMLSTRIGSTPNSRTTSRSPVRVSISTPLT